MAIIGGADGPTKVFFAGNLNMGWINVFGLIIVILILIPNIIYAFKFRGVENKCENRLMNILEQIGRYACMFFMIFNLWNMNQGFKSVTSFLIYLIGNVILIAAYWAVWIMYFKKQTAIRQQLLALIPTCIFLLCGVTTMNFALIVFAILFGGSHSYVTVKNKNKV